MFLLECCWLSDVKFTSSVSLMAIDSQSEVLALKMSDIFHCCFSESELRREAEAMFSKHKLQARADLKPALLGSHLSA